MRASWAAPRSNTRRYDNYYGRDDDYDDGDDCPDDIDKDEWYAYCEGRD